MTDDEFSTIYTTLYNDVLNYALKLSKRSESAEDLTQQAFLVILERSRSGQQIDDPKKYLLSTVHNLHVSGIRHQQVSNDYKEQLPSDKAAAQIQFDDRQTRMFNADQIDLIRSKMSALPERQRKCVELVVLHDLGQSEIADVLGITRQSVNRLLRSAEKTLIELVQPQNALKNVNTDVLGGSEGKKAHDMGMGEQPAKKVLPGVAKDRGSGIS